MSVLHTFVAPMLGVAVRQAYKAHKAQFTLEEWAARKTAFWEGTGRALRRALLGSFTARPERTRRQHLASASVEILQPEWPAIEAGKAESPPVVPLLPPPPGP